MKAQALKRRSAMTADIVVDFLRDWFQSILDDISNLIIGMVIVVACMIAIYVLVGYQSALLTWLTLRTLAINPQLSADQVLGIQGVALYFFVAFTVSVLYSIRGFDAQREDALDRIDDLFHQIENSGLEEETARELIALLGELRKRK